MVRSPRVLDFRILGPLEVLDGETALHLGGAKQRGVLALLLLNANEVVSTGRLIDELWGDSPPDDAATALQAHVSRLRKALPGGPSLLLTQPPGYVLRLDPGQLDLQHFEQKVGNGRAALAAGDAERAASRLREALELWRGRPLVDLENEPFVRDATSHLEDAWLAALECRIDADLALARDAELVTELRALVRAHPLREGLRAKLMLALYRSGRQTEALDVYADARRALVEELGLEPGPDLQRLQQAILAHDPELEPPRRRFPAGRRRALAAAAAAVLVVAALVATFALRHYEERERLVPGEGAIVTFDAADGSVRRSISNGRTPGAIAVRDGVAWVVDADARTILRLSESSRVETFSTGATPTDIAAGADSIWVANGRPLERAQFVGPVATSVAQLDPTTGTGRGSTQLPRRGGALSNLVENHLATRGDAVWAVTPDFAVVRIEAATGAITARSRAVPAYRLDRGRRGRGLGDIPLRRNALANRRRQKADGRRNRSGARRVGRRRRAGRRLGREPGDMRRDSSRNRVGGSRANRRPRGDPRGR